MSEMINGVEYLDEDEWWGRVFEKCARHCLDMSGQEFIDKWNAGDLDLSHDRDNHSAIVQVYMVCPQELLKHPAR